MSKQDESFTHVKADGGVTMVNVSAKVPTKRTATASCFLKTAPSTIQALRRKALPKGDALAVAQVAGIQAAKQTSLLIPLCHSLEIRHIAVDFKVKKNGISVRSYVETIAPTGPEMEALVACSMAGLTLYDMCKAVDKTMQLDAVRLDSKTGGKSDRHAAALKGRRAVLLTLSDRASSGVYADKSGPVAAEMLRKAGFKIVSQEIIPDETSLVTERLRSLHQKLHPDVMLTLGSTGLSPRDIAPEATEAVLDRKVPGFPETFRAQFYPHYPTSSFLSRGIAGLRGRTLIVNLPGRPSAVAEGLSLLIPALHHVFQMVDAEGHEK